jgi:hypothetical protein
MFINPTIWFRGENVPGISPITLSRFTTTTTIDEYGGNDAASANTSVERERNVIVCINLTHAVGRQLEHLFSYAD